jgi:transglutaminase-like putative cysteine protease
MTRFNISHVTDFRYSAEVASSQSTLHVIPRATATQTVLASTITSTPNATDRFDYSDSFGNTSTYLALEQPHQHWTLSVVSTVEINEGAIEANINSLAQTDVAWEEAQALLASGAAPADAIEAVLASSLVAPSSELHSYARSVFASGRGLIDGARALSQQIFADFTFDPAATEVSTPVLEVLRQRRGVCQDFAHLMIGCFRSMGLAARYVSGYLETDPPPNAPKLVGSDASHAWVAFYVPNLGWVDIDPTNSVIPSGRHITVAWGRDYADVAPSRGVVFGPPTTQELTVSVDVVRVHELGSASETQNGRH